MQLAPQNSTIVVMHAAPHTSTSEDTDQAFANMRHRANMFAVECKDSSMFGMCVKNFDVSGLQSHIVLNPEAVVRFCTRDGQVLVFDMLLATYNPKHHKSAIRKIETFSRDDQYTVRSLGLTSVDTLDMLVRVMHARVWRVHVPCTVLTYPLRRVRRMASRRYRTHSRYWTASSITSVSRTLMLSTRQR